MLNLKLHLPMVSHSESSRTGHLPPTATVTDMLFPNTKGDAHTTFTYSTGANHVNKLLKDILRASFVGSRDHFYLLLSLLPYRDRDVTYTAKHSPLLSIQVKEFQCSHRVVRSLPPPNFRTFPSFLKETPSPLAISPHFLPSPWKLLILLFFSRILPFWIFHTNQNHTV